MSVTGARAPGGPGRHPWRPPKGCCEGCEERGVPDGCEAAGLTTREPPELPSRWARREGAGFGRWGDWAPAGCPWDSQVDVLRVGCVSPEPRGEICAEGVTLGVASAGVVFKAINYEKPKQGD